MYNCRFLKRPHIKQRGWFRRNDKKPNGGKPNRNHHREEENDSALGPAQSFLSSFILYKPARTPSIGKGQGREEPGPNSRNLLPAKGVKSRPLE
jgi:hypothetical protein